MASLSPATQSSPVSTLMFLDPTYEVAVSLDIESLDLP